MYFCSKVKADILVHTYYFKIWKAFQFWKLSNSFFPAGIEILENNEKFLNNNISYRMHNKFNIFIISDL